ncbi:MAG: histidine kinase dimerization/phospho-acceptor domain-containing protein [Catenulispora sp.]
MGDQDRLEAGGPPVRGVEAITALVAAMGPPDEAGAALLHAASHALRTPLTSIVGFAEVLADGGAGALNADQEAMVRIITRSASELLRMVDSFEADPRPGSRRDRGGFRG